VGLKSLGTAGKYGALMFTKPWIPQKFARIGRPALTLETTLSVVAALDPRDAASSTPAAFRGRIRFLGACPKGGLSSHLESGIPPGFCSFRHPALAAE
jgi:hypothetical protein